MTDETPTSENRGSTEDLAPDVCECGQPAPNGEDTVVGGCRFGCRYRTVCAACYADIERWWRAGVLEALNGKARKAA